jgi:hypothetical protein
MTFVCSVCGVDQCTMEVPNLSCHIDPPLKDTTYCNIFGDNIAQWEPEEDVRN